jgi:hypothetical protein
MEAQVMLVMSSDTEPDRVFFSRKRYSGLGWQGVTEGVPMISDIIREHTDSFGIEARMSWMIRSDYYMKENWGECAYMAHAFRKTWDSVLHAGDEIGWHPHLLRRNGDVWASELRDKVWIGKCLAEGFASLDKIFGIHSVRMGWCFHNDYTLEVIEKLGIKVDLSPIPGCRSSFLLRLGSDVPKADWSAGLVDPYFPSVRDYRVAGTAERRSVLLIPTTMIDITMKVRLANFAFVPDPYVFYINLPLGLVRRSLDRAIELAKKGRLAVISGCLHPDEIMIGAMATAMKVAYHGLAGDRGFENIGNMLRYLTAKCRHRNVALRFVTANEATEYLLSEWSARDEKVGIVPER